jgi:hypothetical protein
MTRRGHRLAFSNGIIVLTVAALALLLGVGAHVDKLVPFYAIGVFTGFTMAGFGMAKFHHTRREPGWRRKLVVNFTGGLVSLLIVIIFAVVKFTEGAWLVVLLFPLGWLVLMRLNTRYRSEARALNLVTQAARTGTLPATHNYPRQIVLVLVDRLDLAAIRAMRYAGSLRPTDIRALHIVVDSDVARELQNEWIARGLGDRVPLELIDCADRRLVRSAAQAALRTVVQEHAEVTVLMPRRNFGGLSQRILHDRTADRIAEAVGRIPHVAATIVPFDTTLTPEVEERLDRQQARAASEPALMATEAGDEDTREIAAPVQAQPRADGTTPIGAVQWKQQVTVEGRIKVLQVGTAAGRSLEAQVFDSTGGVRLLFFGRTQIPGIEPGTLVRATGRVGEYKGHLALANPRYELVAEPSASRPTGERRPAGAGAR